MRTDIAIDKLCDIAPYVADIMDKMKEDDELRSNLLKFRSLNKTSDYLRYFPQVIKKCNTEIYNILAVVYEKTVEQVREQNFVTETIPQITELFKNEDLRTFFSSLMSSNDKEKVTEDSSTTYENTAEQVQKVNLTYEPYSNISNIE